MIHAAAAVLRCSLIMLLAGWVLCAGACHDDPATPVAPTPVVSVDRAPAAAADPGADVAAEPAAEPPDPGLFAPLAHAKAKPPRDAARIRQDGQLRVLLCKGGSEEAVPNPEAPLARTLAQVDLVASALGVTSRLYVAQDRAVLVAALREGRGDLIACPFAATEPLSPGLVLTAAARNVTEVVVAPAAKKTRLNRAEDLVGKTVIVPAHLPPPTLLPAQARVTAAAPELEPEDVLARVASGEQALAWAYADDFDSFATYNHNAQVVLRGNESQSLTWAVSQSAPELLDVVNATLFVAAMTKHTQAIYGGDLAQIRARRVLRVAMQNDPASYFLFRGQQVGFQFEWAEHVAKSLGVRLEVVVPDKPSELITLVQENRADLAAVAVTEAAQAQVAFSRPFMFAEHVLVQPSKEPPVVNASELAGKRVAVRQSSAYWRTLAELQRTVPDLQIAPADEELGTRELIAKVGKGELGLTVANSALFGVEQTYRDDVQASLVLAQQAPLAYALRSDAKELRAWIDGFLAREYRGLVYNMLVKKYFENKKRIAEVMTQQELAPGTLSPFDELAKRFGRERDLDWRLVVAQMFQESKFDPAAKSWAGAIGLMQVMPKTAAALGCRNPSDPEENVKAGTRYLAQMVASFEPTLPTSQRVRFALAAYNVGLGHVKDARELARRQGFDHNHWFGHVERAMLLLEKPAYYRRARFGYCRGSEPVTYVSRIQSKYDAYTALVPSTVD